MRPDTGPLRDRRLALFKWRSEVWTYATAELARVEAGERAAPSVETFIGELPAMVWPAG